MPSAAFNPKTSHRAVDASSSIGSDREIRRLGETSREATNVDRWVVAEAFPGAEGDAGARGPVVGAAWFACGIAAWHIQHRLAVELPRAPHSEHLGNTHSRDALMSGQPVTETMPSCAGALGWCHRNELLENKTKQKTPAAITMATRTSTITATVLTRPATASRRKSTNAELSPVFFCRSKETNRPSSARTTTIRKRSVNPRA